jgi:hypothetical protein
MWCCAGVAELVGAGTELAKPRAMTDLSSNIRSKDGVVTKRKILIDCDPGHDDAVAILFAARHLELVGVTTVHGNNTIENTTRNALAILEGTVGTVGSEGDDEKAARTLGVSLGSARLAKWRHLRPGAALGPQHLHAD